MSYSAITTALAARIDAISGCDRVYRHEQYAVDGMTDAQFMTLFGELVGSQWRIHFWTLAQTSVAHAPCLDNSAVTKRTHTIEIRGYRVMESSLSSEITFHTLCESVMSNLVAGDRTFGGACQTHDDPQLSRFGNIDFTKFKVHEAIITLRVEENI